MSCAFFHIPLNSPLVEVKQTDDDDDKDDRFSKGSSLGFVVVFFKQKYMFCLPSFLSVDDLEAMRNVNIYRQIRAKNDNQLQSLTDFHVCAHQE